MSSEEEEEEYYEPFVDPFQDADGSATFVSNLKKRKAFNFVMGAYQSNTSGIGNENAKCYVCEKTQDIWFRIFLKTPNGGPTENVHLCEPCFNEFVTFNSDKCGYEFCYIPTEKQVKSSYNKR